MNEQVKNEFLTETPIEYIDIVIYDCQIDGTKTLEAATALANESVAKMIELGYDVVERNGLHYFE